MNGIHELWARIIFLRLVGTRALYCCKLCSLHCVRRLFGISLWLLVKVGAWLHCSLIQHSVMTKFALPWQDCCRSRNAFCSAGTGKEGCRETLCSAVKQRITIYLQLKSFYSNPRSLLKHYYVSARIVLCWLLRMSRNEQKINYWTLSRITQLINVIKFWTIQGWQKSEIFNKK